MSGNLSAFCERAIFVFGSNRAGIHGAGAARWAVTYRGAIFGQGEGLQGQSYALPTKYGPHDSRPDMGLLRDSVARFLHFAASRPDLAFLVTRVGCGLAGFTDAQVAPLFASIPANVYLPGLWIGRQATIVAGSRGISERETALHLDEFSFSGEIVSGMAQGVDLGAYHWAKAKGFPIVEAPALWNRYGRAAGPIRNQWMSWYASNLLALWDGESRGTQNMIQTAQRDGLSVQVVLLEPAPI
ncbi:A1S_2505 family phage non-structural protein [Acidithiobacillus sp.]|uniref:A1S_2505 family phage non-structural protein n=1 Tax=Acidithiobacillus sp. TaxID=1872118 RepID=UPI003D06917B